MTHCMNSDLDDRLRPGDSARCAGDQEALLDHHIEEVLGALSDLAELTRAFDEE